MNRRCGGGFINGIFFGNHSFEVDILSFSGGDGERLCTRISTIYVKDVLRDVGDGVDWGMNIEIHTDLLAVHLTPEFGGMPEGELWVFYWKTGEQIAVRVIGVQQTMGLTYATIQCLKGHGIQAFRFLSSSLMVVAIVSPSHSTATLELFSLPVTNGNVRPTSMTKVAALGLPSVDRDCRIRRMAFSPLFVKNLIIRDNRLLYDVSNDAKLFVNTKSNNIVFACFDIEYDSVSFVVHTSTLLRYTFSSNSQGNMQDPVPWESWGPAMTRWHKGRIRGISEGPYTCGGRVLLKMHSRSWELWDFNPYRVRRLGKGFAVENETASLTVETEPSCARPHGIKEGIYSSLPFVKHIPKKWPPYIYANLFEDRVIGQVVSDYSDFFFISF